MYVATLALALTLSRAGLLVGVGVLVLWLLLASERVQRTCKHIAVAPEIANASITARRARRVMSGGGGRAVVSM